MSSKRKPEGAPESPEKPKKTVKRAGTMMVTAEEGAQFLEKEAPNLASEETKKQRAKNAHMETRATQMKREALTDFETTATGKKEEYTADEEKDLRNQYFMVFRLLDTDKDGYITSEELVEAMRVTGKAVDYDKIERIVNKIGKQRANEITTKEFVDYMMKKNFVKVSKKKKKAAASPTILGQTKKEEKVKPKSEKKTPEKEKVEEKGKGKEKEKPPAKKKEIRRTESITDFYTENAGLHDEHEGTVAVDEHSNPAGSEFDLARDGGYKNFTVLIGNFYTGEPRFDLKDFNKTAGEVLKKKGFGLIFATKETEFIAHLDDVDVAWIISDDRQTHGVATKFTQAVRKFHESGGGLYLWAENEPYFVQANQILRNILGVELMGDTPGEKILTAAKNATKGHFAKHLITSGLKKLFEGETICFPKAVDPRTTVLATSSDGHPAILYAEQGPGKLSDSCGRIVVDTGFTKLWINWNSAGTARYVANATCWLVGVDHKLRAGLPLSRVKD